VIARRETLAAASPCAAFSVSERQAVAFSFKTRLWTDGKAASCSLGPRLLFLSTTTFLSALMHDEIH
jgi:hypothetical protein